MASRATEIVAQMLLKFAAQFNSFSFIFLEKKKKLL